MESKCRPFGPQQHCVGAVARASRIIRLCHGGLKFNATCDKLLAEGDSLLSCLCASCLVPAKRCPVIFAVYCLFASGCIECNSGLA